MKLTVKENRELIMINSRNTQNENDVEILQITVPEKYEDFNKKIVFITDDGVVWDLIENDTYTLKRAITKYESVKFYIWLTKDEQDFRSAEKILYFNKNHKVDGEVTPEEQSDMERVIAILEEEITKVNTKEQELIDLIEDIQAKLDNGDFIGEQGPQGPSGQDGKDGKDGRDGTDGKDGKNGQDGYTPVRGTDYWTEEDKAEIIEDVENDIEIPTKTSDLNNDSGFITNAVDNLLNYYKKNEIFTKQEVNDLISAITTMDLRVVQTLPTQDISTTTIYLVPKTTAETNNAYDEYIYVSSSWEFIGSTEVDLSDYVKNTDYATASKGGVIKTNAGLEISGSTGLVRGSIYTYEQYQSAGNVNFISKGTLENVIAGKNLETANNKVTELTEESTDEEYPSAKVVYENDQENYKEITKLKEKIEKYKKQLPKVEGQGTDITLNNTIEDDFIEFDVSGRSVQGKLPTGYTQLDYIESTETQYINTGYVPVQGDNFEFKNVTPNISTGIKILFDAAAGSYRLTLLLGKEGSPAYYKYFASGDAPTFTTPTMNKSTIKIVNGSLYIDDVLQATSNYESSISSNLLLFGNANEYISTKMGEVIISNNNVIKRDFIPCKNSNNVVGMYDLVTGVFYNNAGTGTFIEGNAIPNPDYEQPIKNCGDNVNELNIESVTGYVYVNGLPSTIDVGMIIDSFDSNNMKFHNSAATYNIALTNIIQLKPNTTYTISFEREDTATNKQWFVYDYDGTNYSINYRDNNVGLTSKTFTTNSVGKIALAFGFGNVTGVATISNIKIEEGTKATPYSPYGCGNVNVKVSNKNLFDKDNANTLNTAISASGTGSDSASTYRSVYIPCRPNTTYTVSKKFDATKNRFAVAYSDTLPTYNMPLEGVINNQTKSELTITTGANAKYLLAYIWISGGTENVQDMINSVQIEVNSTATDYIAHAEQNISIPTQQPMRSIGDVRDDFVKTEEGWFERHKIGNDVFDGTENWVYSTSLGAMYLSNFMKVISNDEIGAYSNKYYATTRNNYNINDYTIYGNASGVLSIRDINYTDVNEFKTYLQTANVEVTYLLATPTLLPCTEEQTAILDEIPEELYTYNGQTNISSPDEVAPYIKASGLMDLNALVTRVEVLESQS